MWIARARYLQDIQTLRDYAAGQKALVDELRAELDRALTAETALHLRLERSQLALTGFQERLTADIATSAAARAYSDAYRVEINTLREEKGALMKLLMPTLVMEVPRVLAEPLPKDYQEGVGSALFDDLGDSRASASGYADLHDVSKGGKIVGTPAPFADPAQA